MHATNRVTAVRIRASLVSCGFLAACGRYDRFWEARQRWADCQASVRAIVMLALSHFEPGRARDVILAHAATFPFALKQHVRGHRDLSRLHEAWLPYVEPRLGPERARAALARVVAEDNMPSALLESLSSEVGILLRPHLPSDYRVRAADASGQRQAALWAQLQSHVEALAATTAACERLKLTPIPWSYARHTSRFCSLFLLTLPLALAEECPIGTWRCHCTHATARPSTGTWCTCTRCTAQHAQGPCWAQLSSPTHPHGPPRPSPMDVHQVLARG